VAINCLERGVSRFTGIVGSIWLNWRLSRQALFSRGCFFTLVKNVWLKKDTSTINYNFKKFVISTIKKSGTLSSAFTWSTSGSAG